MTLPFHFQLSTRVIFGAGSRAALLQVVDENGWRRVGLVVDQGLRDVAQVAELVGTLRDQASQAVVAWCTISEPSYDALEEMRPLFADQHLDAIVGIGGGSAMDMAKAMAALIHNRGPALQYRGFDRLTEPVLPIVAVPTTAGTGSEVTPNASFVDLRAQRKMGINGEAVRPRYALLDPELTLSCPRSATISTGLDSLVHATEAYVAKKTNRIARMFAREGFGLVFNALPQVVVSPGDLALRSEVMYGAFLAGVALMHSGTGPAAAMSYPLGVRHDVPHGLGGAVFLPSVAAHNVRAGVSDYADLYQVVRGADLSLSSAEQAAAFVVRLNETWGDLEVPRDLRSVGLNNDAIDRFVAETMELGGALEQNPVAFGEAEIRRTLRELM